MPDIRVLNELTIKKDGVLTTYKLGTVNGYYNPTDGKFYEEVTHVTEIEGAPNLVYADIAGNALYIYKTATSSFVKVSGEGGSSSDNLKFGYLNDEDGKFYEDDQYQVEIPGNADYLFIGLDNDTIYRYDTSDTAFVAIGGGGGTEYQAGFGININDDEISTTDFVGTQAEWDALTNDQKAAYDFVHITDDTTNINYSPGHAISDGTSEKTQREVLEFNGFDVTDDSVNGKTKIAEVPYTAGDGIEITNKEVSVGDEISRTWTGTKAEWDAISDKSIYDGWIINITDDAAVGAGPVVDVVADGNLNAVTSNAVYDALLGKLDNSKIKYGISSNTVDTTGSITFDTAFADANYVVFICPINPNNAIAWSSSVISKTASGFVFETKYQNTDSATWISYYRGIGWLAVHL